MTKSPNRTSVISLFIFIAIIVFLILSFQEQSRQKEALSINEVADLITQGKVDKISLDENNLLVMIDGVEFISEKEPSSGLLEQLEILGVTPDELLPSQSGTGFIIEIKPPSAWLGILSALGYFFPFILFALVFWFIFRQTQGSNSSAMAFGKSKARMFTGENPTITFEDVAGVEEAKEDLMEIVEFLKEPQKFIELGARIPKGVLLVGLPGTGKTLMAKATSGEAGVPFFSISGSEFVEMFVGVGASRVRDLFDQAKRHAPCIVFIDEIDAVGRQRGAGLGGSHDEREQTLNQMLVEMDGFDTDTNIIMIAATNRPDILDPALMRPGRFDRRVMLDRPDVKGREAILQVHVKGKPLAPEVDLMVIARGTPGFVGADLENLVNEAAILAARRDKKVIEQDEFQESIERVMMGPERKSKVISPEEKVILAYHEAGHAVVGHALPNATPIHKITIIARGMAGGYVLSIPEEDREMTSRNKLLDEMAMGLAGRAAEEIMFDDITAGASNDLERATSIARTMVTRLAMGSTLGQRVFGKKQEIVFLGREISEQRDYSEAVAEKIDEEVMVIVENAYIIAKETLLKYKNELVKIAEKLMEVETLSKAEFEELFPTPVEKRVGGTPQLTTG